MIATDDKVRIKPEVIDDFRQPWRDRFKRPVMVGTVIAVRDNGRIRVHWKGVQKQKWPHEWHLEMDQASVERIDG